MEGGQRRIEKILGGGKKGGSYAAVPDEGDIGGIA